MSRSTLIVGSLLWAAAIGGLILIWQQRRDETSPNAPNSSSSAAESSPGSPVTPEESSVKVSFPARPLPDFRFDRATGGTLGLDDLKGKRWVASFVFTRCTSTCPTITRAVMEVHDRVQENAKDVMFVTFTVDPKFDSVDVLKNYSETFTRGNWDRWAFLTGGQQEIFELIVNGFGLYVKENLGKSRMPGFEVAHSNRVVLVNEDGIPVGTFLGTVPADMVKLRRILSGQDEFPEPGPANTPGFTISTSDGQPLSIQFKAVPANDADTPAAADTPEDSTAVENNGTDTDSEDTDSEDTDEQECANDAVEEDTDSGSDSDADGQENAQAASPEHTTSKSDGEGGDSLPSSLEAGDLIGPPEAVRSATEHNTLIDQRLPVWARRLPAVNAALNSLAALLLLTGLVAIRSGRKHVHRRLMISAFLTSAVFLACYLVYHYALGKYTGEHGKRFAGDGLAAAVYPFILWPHIAFAVLVPAMAIRVFQHAFAERWDAHRKLARITFPIWMFVSVTGVIIYGMLYHWPEMPGAPASVGVARWVSAIRCQTAEFGEWAVI
ncbi:MAG: DUF420 domain-containing protein [Planctomycetaceae bacterium]